MPPTLEVTTTRGTPSAAAASTAMRGPSALTCHTRSGGLEPTTPAVWKSRSHPFTARRMAAAVEHVGADRLGLQRGQTLQPRLVAERHPDLVAALDELADDVAADETRPPCHANLHGPSLNCRSPGRNFLVLLVFEHSYTGVAP